MNKNIPDPTRENTVLNWSFTYEWTVQFLIDHPELKIGAEIGVAGGQHIKNIIEKTNIQKMYGIDPYVVELWDMGYVVNVDKIYGGFNNLYEEVNQMLSSYGDKVELIRKKSLDAVLDFDDESLDFVFIDAAHDYENCYQDIKYWQHKVRKGGYVMGHDWDHPACPGVQKAVVEHYGDTISSVSSPVHVWYIQK